MTRPFLKAGIFGGIALVVLNLLGLIPVIGLCTLPLGLIIYGAAGALAASWLPSPRTVGTAAGQGALAGLIAGAIAGLLQVVLAPLNLAMAGGPEAYLQMMPAENLQQLEQMGVDPNALFGAGTFAGAMLICCLPLTLAIGAGLGALGGLIYAAVRPDSSMG